MKQHSFLPLAANFKAVFLDSYGVLKNYKGLIAGVQHSIDALRSRDIAIRILTNDASRSADQQAESFTTLGLQGIAADEIITSGMMARDFLLQKINSGKIAYLGTENSAHYILQSGLEHIAVSNITGNDINDISAFVFLDDEGFDWNYDINKTINLLRKINIPVIVANSDKIYPVSKNDVAIATGGIAKLAESILNKKFIHFGKPDTQMFTYAFEDLNRQGNYRREDILMVGDNLNTDILGGNKFGLKTALVLSGNTQKDTVDLEIEASGIIPDFICDSILV